MGVACLEFLGENFHGWLKNHEIRESFLPRKFPAIRYSNYEDSMGNLPGRSFHHQSLERLSIGFK